MCYILTVEVTMTNSVQAAPLARDVSREYIYAMEINKFTRKVNFLLRYVYN